MEYVILVDENDQEVGLAEKMEAHLSGKLHRAFSVILFNPEGDMLLQQRADHKYHSAGLWSNACCSHPRPGEDVHEAVSRRLKEELGVELNTDLIDKFQYRAEFENGLVEHELDYVFKGYIAEVPKGNPEEVKDLKFINLAELEKDIAQRPEDYTVWFRMILERMSKISLDQ